ncbi:MAG: methylenetetrahydrofolate reductase [NAD(P)H] [Rhodobacteraceae bacterium]|nr:methylenetetrahydrofolate reductase [NAD(P)H] [Paracoccaceae bacterium]
MTTISFEFFPPKSMAASFRLWDTIHTLAPLNPDFVSVTYGAGGTTRALTHEAVREIGRMTGLNVAAHLTCVDATREETLAIAQDYAKSGVKRIVALRGDPADGQSAFTPHPDGFANSCELISALRDAGDFDITVGAYPDPHPEAASADADIDWLKRKVDAGATSAITQFFFEADTFLRFRDRAVAAGVDIPVLPGILPVENWTSTRAFATRCGAAVPNHIAEGFERAERDDRLNLFATVHATDLCTDLIEGGVEHLHFYTLNRPSLTRDVVHALGLAPPVPLEYVA